MSQPYQSSKQVQPKVIAGIPAYNVAGYVSGVIRKARKYVSEVIVVDDGSTDSTAQVSRATGALVISHGVNRGYGEAVKSCFEVGRVGGADVLVTLDGDGQHNADEIQKVVAPIINKEADIVIGSRFLNNRLKIPRYRRFGIKVITFLFNFGAKVKIHDTQSGFRAYSKQALNVISVTETGMSISVETLIKARAAGLEIREVAISCLYHPDGSTKNPVIHGLGVALSVIRLRLKGLTNGQLRVSNA